MVDEITHSSDTGQYSPPTIFLGRTFGISSASEFEDSSGIYMWNLGRLLALEAICHPIKSREKAYGVANVRVLNSHRKGNVLNILRKDWPLNQLLRYHPECSSDYHTKPFVLTGCDSLFVTFTVQYAEVATENVERIRSNDYSAVSFCLNLSKG